MSQLDWLSSTTAMIVLFWSKATRDLLKSFGWGIAALHRLHAARKLPSPRRPPHRISLAPPGNGGISCRCLGGARFRAPFLLGERFHRADRPYGFGGMRFALLFARLRAVEA